LLAVPDMGHGGVHLVTERGDQFELSLSALHGEVAVTLDGAGTYYALTPDNILSGLPREQHVERGCPCCGVGIHSYASRFHMPRARAIDVARDFLAHRDAETTRWLEIPTVFFDGRDWA